MFRLHRHKPEKSGEKVDFKFSHFHALQVPKAWDKLFVSIISVETGKTIAKLSKATVHSGNCQWNEVLSESIWLAQDDTSKELEESLFKFVLSMGSARSGILGEAVVNLADYTTSKVSVPVSLPLKKCNYGTTLQVKIQCLSPRQRNEKQRKETTSNLEDLNKEFDDMDNKSDGSDSVFNRSVGSSSSNHIGSNSHPAELGSRDMSFSASGSHRSSDSGEGYVGRVASSPWNNVNNGDTDNLIRRQDSTDSWNNGNTGNGPVDDHSRPNLSSFNSRGIGSGIHLQTQWQELTSQNSFSGPAPLPFRTANSSKDLLEAAEDTIEELRAEAKMWEGNSRKSKLDLEILRKEFSDQSRRLADLEMELLAAYTKRDAFKLEIEQLKLSLDELVVKKNPADSLRSQAENINQIQKELEDEIKFQKDANANMSLQLKKTQESNIELLSILQELEETIEKQRSEIEYLSSRKEDSSDMRSYNNGSEESSLLDLNDGTLVRHVNAGHGNEGRRHVEETTGNSCGQMGISENLSMEHQLAELQESQRTLQFVVQSLEKSVDEKVLEIEIVKRLRDQCETEWAHKLSVEEEKNVELETKLSNSLNFSSSLQMGSASGGDPDMIKEIEALQFKVQELGRDCNELTDENLELILKMKESKSDPKAGGASFGSASDEFSTSFAEAEIVQLKSQVHLLEQKLKESELLQGTAAVHLQTQTTDGEEKCACLELELQSFKNQVCNLSGELHESRLEMEKKEIEVTALRQQIETYRVRGIDWDNQHSVASVRIESSVSDNLKEISKIFSDMYKQLQLALATLKKPWNDADSHILVEHHDGLELTNSFSTDSIIRKEHAEAMVSNLLELNDLLGAKIVECKELQQSETKIEKQDAQSTDAQKLLNDYIIKENSHSLLVKELEKTKKEFQFKTVELGKELEADRSVIAELQAGLLLKEEEIKALRHSRRELEARISDLQREKDQMEEGLETAKRESVVTSKCLDDVQQNLMILTSCVDSHVSANKMLERKAAELESGKLELELNVSELEEENVQLSERLSGLEAQLRHLTDERESSRLELERSSHLLMDHKNEIEKLGIEMEMQKVDLREKLLESQSRCSKAEEESEILKRSQLKLQATVESLIEECNSLQKLNEELRRQRLKLHEHCTHLEAALRESRKKFSDCCKKVELLEEKCSKIYEDVASKEILLTSELEMLLHQHNQNQEKLVLAESLLNQTNLEKTAEVKNLQREVALLAAQILSTHDEKERMASEAVLEVSSLRADKNRLENSLEQYHTKAEQCETELRALRLASENKVQGLTNMLSAAKQNEELSMAENEHMKRLLEKAKLVEERSKSMSSETEMKIKALEYERQLLMDEIASLKAQVQDMAHLQDEISALKSLLDETKYEKGKLQSSLQVLSTDCEELKAERFSFIEKISNMQKALSEGEECMRTKVALEEKLLRLECDLSAKEASCANDVELKNELNRIKRTNSQLHRKIQCLEEEKDECLRRAHVLEEELKLKKEKPLHEGLVLSRSSNENLPDLSLSNAARLLKGDNKLLDHKERPQFEAELLSKIQLLETRLAEALETNKYDIQPRSCMSHNAHRNDLKNSELGDEASNEESAKRASLLEADLREMRDRYFHMSLRYAEVEAQREELVMKVKSLTNGKRWFS